METVQNSITLDQIYIPNCIDDEYYLIKISEILHFIKDESFIWLNERK